MKELAKEFQLLVCWFYGEPGHGKGTIDAMSPFGCKTPLRKDIIRNDNWFENAEKIEDSLKTHFEGDDTKHHYLVDAEMTAEKRQKTRGAHIIHGSRKMT